MRIGVRASFGRCGDRAETSLARAGRCVHSAGSGTSHDNCGTCPRIDYADTNRNARCHRDADTNRNARCHRDANTNRRTHSHRHAYANPHSTSYRDANTVPNCYADTNAHSQTVGPLQACHASRTHGLRLVGLEL